MSTPAVCVLPLNRSLPERLRAGDQHSWTVQAQLADGTPLPDGTFLLYVLTGVIQGTPVRQILFQPAGAPGSYTGGVQVTGAEASFTLSSTATAAWHPGRYQWICFSLDAAGDRQQVAEGDIRIEPNPLATVPADPRSFNLRMLEQIRAVLYSNALDDVGMYKIGGRELTKIDRMTLMRQEGLFEARVRDERRRQGQYVPTNTKGITFGGRW